MTDDDASRRLLLRSTFDTAADRYDVARPQYPSALFDDLVALAGLVPGRSRLLEVGCGTGLATVPLAARGFSISCVELGPSLAAIARARLAEYPDVSVSVGTFEDWPVADDGSFDLVYAATSWHWIDPSTRWAKAAALLRPGGHLAIWEATHAFPPGFDPFFGEILEVYEAIGETRPGDVWPPLLPEDVPDAAAEILATGLFGPSVAVRRYVWELTYSADEYVALLDTFSNHIAMAPEKRRVLDDEVRARLGSRRVRRHFLAVLHVAPVRK